MHPRMNQHSIIDAWEAWATADAERRELPGLTPVLQAFAATARALRAADWNPPADADAGARATDSGTTGQGSAQGPRDE
jgi:hypothetical protein